MDTSKPIKTHQACDRCGSHDALARYSDGHTYCFSCGAAVFPDGDRQAAKKEAEWTPAEPPLDYKFAPIVKAETSDERQEYRELKARKITAETCRRYDYQVVQVNGETLQVANYKDDRGQPIGQKIRSKDKQFRISGKISERFFAQDKWSKGESLVITEGEIDCLSVAQATGYRQPVVSLPTGAQSAAKVVGANIEWLDGYSKVIIMTDMDKPGRAAAEKIAELLPPGKAYIASLSEKDANDCLKAGKGGDICEAIARAKPWRPDGILSPADLLTMLQEPDDSADADALPWEIKLGEMLDGGLRKRRLYVLTAGTGIGKSTTARQIAHWLSIVDGRRVGMIMLEESPRETALKLMGIHLQHKLPDNCLASGRDSQAAMQAYNDIFGGGNMVIYNHFGSLDVDVLLNKIRYMSQGLHCDYVVLDHISIVISGLPIDNERKATDVLMTRLRSLVEETGVGLIAISHLSRQEGTPAEEGGKITLNSLRGSHAIAQLSDVVIALERNEQADDEDDRLRVAVRVLKNRGTGETGLAGHLKYNKQTTTLEVCEPPKATTLGDMLADQMTPQERARGYKYCKDNTKKPQGAAPKTWAEMGVEVGPIAPAGNQKQAGKIEENPFDF